jgi:hypothetical protein
MNKVDSYQFMLLALYVGYLRHVKTMPAGMVKERIGKICDLLEGLHFRVALEGCGDLMEFSQELEMFAPDEPLVPELRDRFVEIMRGVENVVHAEARTRCLYNISQMRYSATYLMEDPGKLFAPGVFDGLPEMSRYDFSEGFKCLALGRATAAAFHILRGTEALLKVLYSIKVKKRKRVEVATLVNMVGDLLNMRKDPLPGELVNALDMIGASYPDPQKHSEVRYDVDQVQNLLGVCIEVVNRMVMEISGCMAHI